MAKKVANSALVKTAERVGKTLGKTARKLDKLKAVVKRAKPRSKSSLKDPVVAAKRAKTQEVWKGRKQEAEAAARSAHGNAVDERARVRATTGHRWTARKPS